ncbi:hypothetical protein D1007_29697 [Hordeum vulgare]|nr:hypothetical protein D1007_29697 [Hordeum vulgare]
MASLDVPSLRRAGAVCKSWRATHHAFRLPELERAPCLLYACKEYGPDDAALYCPGPATGTTFRVPGPAPPLEKRGFSFACQGGWVFTTDDIGNPYLVNPVTGAPSFLWYSWSNSLKLCFLPLPRLAPPLLTDVRRRSPPHRRDRPRRFPHLPLRGLNLRRAHRDYLLRFHSLPEASPFEPLEEGASAETTDRRACAVVREVLEMTVEKRTLVYHLTHFRGTSGCPTG